MVPLKQRMSVCLSACSGHLVLIYFFKAKCSHFAVSDKADFCSPVAAESEESAEHKLDCSRGHVSWHREFGAFVPP